MGSWVGDLNEISFVNVLGSLSKTDTAPTVQGLYILSDVGTYTNLGGIVTTAGKLNYASFDGTTWSLVSVDINSNSGLPDSWYNYSVSSNQELPFELTSGQVNSNGTFSTSTNWVRVFITSGFSAGDTIKFTGLGNFVLTTFQPPYVRIMFKNNSTILSYIAWEDGVNELITTIPIGCNRIDVQIAGGTNVGTNLSTSPYLNSFKAIKIITGDNIESIKKQYLEGVLDLEKNLQLVNSKYNPRFAHISFDDVNFSLQDLINNSASYTSIFQNPFFELLKTLNTNYGAIFSCYCFNENTAGYNISNLPTKFITELKSVSSWLKFGFHSLNSSTNYASGVGTTVKSHYNNFINAIVPFAGIDSVDRVVRLQNFAGNLETCLALRDTNCGIIGLLTADDTRNSYYLTTAQSTYINSHERINDVSNFLQFFKTETRFESSSSILSFLTNLKTIQNANLSTELVMFTHEYELYPSAGGSIISSMNTKLETVCNWVKQNGYVWDYPMNRI